MARFNQLFNQLIFLIILIPLITSQINWVYFDPTSYSVTYTHEKRGRTSTIAVDFQNYPVPYYIKVVATPEEGSSTPILCFSPKSNTCADNRVVLTRNSEQPSILYVRREEFQDQNSELYIYATCQNSDCDYSVKFEGMNSAEIDPNTIFSYTVTNYNKEMVYDVIGSAQPGSYLTIGIEGSSKVDIFVDNIDKEPTYLDNGKIIVIPLVPDENSNNLAKFTIKGANVGEYLTLNTHIVTGAVAPDNLLYPNGPVVMGMLDGTDGYFKEECFPISAFESEKYSNVNKYYLTGKIHSKYALFWLADEKGLYMEDTELEIADGQLAFLIETNGKARSVCFEYSYEETVKMPYVAYSVSILEPTKLESIYNFYPPQVIGETYRRMIPKGSVAVYNAAKLITSDKRFSFNMYNRKGVAELYVTECNEYPDCLYSTQQLQNLNQQKKVGKMTIYEGVVDKDVDALSKSKYVMIVYCRDDDNQNKGYCEVDTNVNTAGKTIKLVENEKFSKHVLEGEKGEIKIDFKGGVKIQRLGIDIMIHSGDVEFSVQGFENKLNNDKLKDVEFDYFKYYLSNKIYYHFNFAQLVYEEFVIDYTAAKNSFFTIQYEYHPTNLYQMEETVRSGESYLVQIDPTARDKYKFIHLVNDRYKKEQPFLANFFSLNCEFKVFRNNKEIEFFDGYAQEVLTKDTEGYADEEYIYGISLIEADVSNYNHKMCMLYVAGYESKDTESESEIVVGENVNQQIIFDKNLDTIRFLYPQPDPSKDLAINFNIIDKAFYNIKIFFNSKKNAFKEFTLTTNKIYHIPSSVITDNCELNTLCSVIVEAKYDKGLDALDKTGNPMIEITVRQIENVPSYLQKSQAKRDFTCGDKFYYLYTDIGKNEVGDISVNFLRDFGNVWAKIVRKDQTQADEEANWRGFYRMPSKDWEDSFLHNQYTKKIEFGVEETQDCIEGCYLLLSIQISQIGDYVEDFKFYPFSIITRITPNNYAYTDIPKVRIQVNEFIVGTVEIAQNEKILQFYEVWLPHDSYRVEFDFQSKVAGLYINLGGTRPTTKNADFALLPPGRDSVLYLDKYSILQKADKKKIKIPVDDSLQDINLVIGVWTDKTDSMNIELFSLCVREPNDNVMLDIIEVNSDQKIMCSPKFINDDQYRCLFMLVYDDEDVKLQMPLIVHASSTNRSAIVNAHARFIEREYYDEYNVNSLRNLIPTVETATFSTQRDDVDYIFTRLNPSSAGDKHYYFFVNVISSIQTDLFLLTSMPMYNEIGQNTVEFYPNPSTEQLLFLSVDKLNLIFFTSASIIANIVSLGGEADVAWSKDPQTIYNLRGRGDRIALTSGTTLNEITITKNANSQTEEGPGFVFYVSYYERNGDINFDEIEFGKSTELSYRDTDLPVYLYSKIDGFLNNIIAAVTFKDSDLDNEGQFYYSRFLVKGAITKESLVYKTKKNPELAPSFDSTIYGAYDPAIKTAIVFFSYQDISYLNIKAEDNPTLYLEIQKNGELPDKTFNKFDIEAQFSKINGDYITVEKTYNYGRYSGNWNNYYKLKRDKRKKYMFVEISFNSKYLNFALNNGQNRNNLTNLIKSAEKARGKVILLLDTTKITTDFIYLTIFKTTNADIDNHLFNYVFKYVNTKTEEEFVDYKILGDDNNLKYEEQFDENTQKTTIKCRFNKLLNDKVNVTYFFKIVDNESHYYEEEVESIAVMESPYMVVYKRNPKDFEGEITLTAQEDQNLLSNWVYLQVIAQIQEDNILEYVAYKGIVNLRPPTDVKESSGGVNSAFFISFMVIILVIIAGLVVVVFIFQQKNKNLAKQVKHISFQQNAGNAGGSNVDPNLLLKNSQQAEAPQ